MVVVSPKLLEKRDWTSRVSGRQMAVSKVFVGLSYAQFIFDPDRYETSGHLWLTQTLLVQLRR